MVDNAAVLQVLVAEGGDLLVVNGDASVAGVRSDRVGDVGWGLTVGLSRELVGRQDHSRSALKQGQTCVVHHGNRRLYHLQAEQPVERAVVAVGYVEVENPCGWFALTERKQEVGNEAKDEVKQCQLRLTCCVKCSRPWLTSYWVKEVTGSGLSPSVR